MSASFHLHNRGANRVLNIILEGGTIRSRTKLTYICVKLDKALTFQRQSKSLHQKLTSVIELLRQVARLSPTHSNHGTCSITAEHCAPAWTGVAANTLIEKSINSAQRRPTVTGIPQLLQRIAYLYWQA